MEDKRLGRKRMLRFATVGVFNTIFDFGVLNSLVFLFSLPSIAANIISGSLAASVSYLLNRKYVFNTNTPKTSTQFLMFFAITAFGIYGIQNIIIYLLTNYVTAPSHWFFELIEIIKPGFLGKDVVVLNFAKAMATIASLSWNYFMYGRYVFRKDRESS